MIMCLQAAVLKTSILLLGTVWLSSLLLSSVESYTYYRFRRESERRNLITEEEVLLNSGVDINNASNIPTVEYDIVSLDRYLRNYLAGPINDHFVYLNYDVIAAYVGPVPLNTPMLTSTGELTNGTRRLWAMFDEATQEACALNAIHNYGQLALFSCPTPGIYRAYAYEYKWASGSKFPKPTLSLFGENPTEAWLTKHQKAPYDIMFGSKVEKIISHSFGSQALTVSQRIQIVMQDTVPLLKIAVSDPVVVQKSVFCYYWMYRIVEKARVGYIQDEVVPSVGVNSSSYLLMDLMIWIAEPSAVHTDETTDDLRTISIADYSKLLTNRFYAIGLFPCLRKAHSVVEIVEEIRFVPDTDQNNPLNSAPHWRAVIKIHTDRLISTLSDVSFTIASRQNTAYFNCFVGDTRVFINIRKFSFVKRRKLDRGSINLDYSNLWGSSKKLVKAELKQVYGHGVQYIGYKWSKVYQPATSRTDMVIVNNPCVAQEFAFAIGGSLYVAEGMLDKGHVQATKVYLPDFSNPYSKEANPAKFRHYLRVFDMAFTPTHLAILLTDGYVLLHSSSISQKGVARLTNAEKYQSAAFAKRRWCPRTATPKLSSMMLPIFSTKGYIVVLQLYPTEGSVPMWTPPPSIFCLSEGVGFVEKAKNIDREKVANETDIHYNEFAAVERSSHTTGVREKSFDQRPEPPPPPKRNLDEENTFLLNSNSEWIADGTDPHFPPALTNPASHVLSDDWQKYNEAVIYVLEDDMKKIKKMLEDNGITNIPVTDRKDDINLYTVEFTAVEKQFLIAIKFKAAQIPNDFSFNPKQSPFQLMITTVTVTNYPFRVKLHTDLRPQDEQLETIIPFPGVILLRSKPYQVSAVTSRDPREEEEHQADLKGLDEVEYSPEIFTMNTAIPSYVIDFGDILLYSTLDGRYARPLHFFEWNTINSRLRNATLKQIPLTFDDSSIVFRRNSSSLFDVVVTEQGIISVLWRKARRHLIQDDEECLTTEDTDTQPVAMGSVVSLEGLRQVKPFFRNDNIFQRVTPDGEVVYGLYTVKPHGSMESCTGTRKETKSDAEICVEQPTEPMKPSRPILHVCTTDTSVPCTDPGYLRKCIDDIDGQNSTEACIRMNSAVEADYCGNRTGAVKDDNFKPPQPAPNITVEECGLLNFTSDPNITDCLPKFAPRESLREVNILGTPFLSYLLGSLKSLKSKHPEAPLEFVDEQQEEPDLCPFTSFVLYNTDFDFAEVGYQTRITGEISYLGSGVPTEADLIVEYERSIGIIIEVSSTLEEERGLTTIRKTIDIKFEMTDYSLEQFKVTSDEKIHNISGLDYEDIRARENTTVFSITLRPSIVNMRCKNTDFFKTIQFNVGCNVFSEIRLLSEASPLKRVNWTEALQTNNVEYKWFRDMSNWNLTIPIAHIYRKQKELFCTDACRLKGSNCYCNIPFYKYYKDEIFTISYRDLFFPQFEQFLTVSSRRVTGNVVIYDLLGSNDFDISENKLKAGCYSNGGYWYLKLLETTTTIGTETSVHENIYKHYKDCFEVGDSTNRELPYQLDSNPFYIHNLTNKNKITFRRNRNQIFIFRAVIVNTHFNRFTYCRLLETFFMVRVTGIPIPRQSLYLWHYLLVILFVVCGFVFSYALFYKFYTWKLDLGNISDNQQHTGGQVYSEWNAKR